MPKMKTHRGAAKRFKKTGSGKLSRQHAYASHNFSATTKKQKRGLRQSTLVSRADTPRLKALLPYD